MTDMTKTPPAPKTLSAALRMAADDLESLVVNGQHSVNMDRWIDASYPGTCEVCMAGAAMKGRLPLGADPRPRDYSPEWLDALMSLDRWRSGMPGLALKYFDCQHVHNDYIDKFRYREFRGQMSDEDVRDILIPHAREAAAWLKERGA